MCAVSSLALELFESYNTLKWFGLSGLCSGQNAEVRIKSTLLSQKPRQESLLIALLRVTVLSFVSLLLCRVGAQEIVQWQDRGFLLSG